MISAAGGKPRKKQRRARLFIGASVESLDVANAVQENLERDAECTVWHQGVFEVSQNTLESLVRAVETFDFAAFVFAPTDISLIRKQKKQTVRDNVVFELGLFIGELGITRCFIIMPRDEPNFHLPSDLLGLTPATFDPGRQDQNLVAALGPACSKIRRAVHSMGAVRGKGRMNRTARKFASSLAQPALKSFPATVGLINSLTAESRALVRSIVVRHLTERQYAALKRSDLLSGAIDELRRVGILVPLSGFGLDYKEAVVYWFPSAVSQEIRTASLLVPVSEELEDAVEEELEQIGYRIS